MRRKSDFSSYFPLKCYSETALSTVRLVTKIPRLVAITARLVAITARLVAKFTRAYYNKVGKVIEYDEKSWSNLITLALKKKIV